MAVLTDNWIDNIQNIWHEISPLFTNLKTLDFKQLTVKDYLTLIGLSFTVAKSLFVGWQALGAFKQYGVAKIIRPNFVKKYGKWAVVTAPDVGIGEAYCTELASCGLNLFLVASMPEQCRAMAVYLEGKYKVETHIANIDFTNCRSIYEQIFEQVGDREVGILVNNLETKSDMDDEDFVDLDKEAVSHLLHYTMMRATLLSHLFLPGMLERGRGAIVILAPSTVNLPPGQKAVYGACKSYMDFFAHSLNEQYKEQGITVQTLLPFIVANKGNHVPSAVSLLVPSASSYARDAVSTLGWSERSNGCLQHQLQAWLTSFMPTWLTKLIAAGLSTLIQRQSDRIGLEMDDETARNFTSSILESSTVCNPGSLLDYLIY